MNRKLREMLKSAYGSQQPENKNVFLQQIKSDRAWRRIHPISSFFGLHPFARTVFAAAAVVTVGTGVIAYAFSSDRAPKPPDDPLPVVAETTDISQSGGTSTTPRGTTTRSDDRDTTTEKTQSATTASNTSQTSEKSTKSTSRTSRKTTHTTTAVTTSASTTASTSVYYTDLWGHPSNIDELRGLYIKKNQDFLLYGYPDYNIFKDIPRIWAENKDANIDIDERIEAMVLSEYPDVTPEEYPAVEQKFLSEEFVHFMLVWVSPPIVEGVTTNIEYIAVDGKPWTICEVTLSEVYNFDVDVSEKKIFQQKGQTIKIAEPGGYMSVRDYIRLNPDDKQFADWSDERIDSTVIYEAGSNQKKPEIGDRFVYMLNEMPDDFPVKNCYHRTAWCDIFQFRRSGDNYVSCNNHYPDVVVRQEELDSFKDELDYFYDPDSDRCIVFRDHAFLFYGAFSCYTVAPDGTMSMLDYVMTDDGYYPFYRDSTSESRDELGRPIVNGYYATLTWTDSGVILEYCDTSDTKTLEYNIPK